jgi:hypothetical protein
MRDLIPARLTLQVISKSLGLSVPEGANLKSTVFKNNNGCLTLTTIPKMALCTSKHIGAKHFWFWSHCGPKSEINIVEVDTKEQLPDQFIKGLGIDAFTPHLCLKLMGRSVEVREGVSQNALMDQYF